MNLLPLNVKQLPSAGRMKHFGKNWQKSTKDSIILGVIKSYKVPFMLLPRQPKLQNLCELTKETIDLVDQEVKNMLRKGAIVVSDLKEAQFFSSLFAVKKRDGGIAQ